MEGCALSPDMTFPHAGGAARGTAPRRSARGPACALQRLGRIALQAAAAAALACAGAAAGAVAARAADGAAAPAPWEAREEPLLPGLDRPPLDGALVLTGTFGEYRSSHLHAGLDFSTGGEVGRPVYASLDGRIERVRASGAGFGRALYLRARDGRLLVYAHLDAFEAPLAAYVAAAQDSSGDYEQDLWPEAGRFPVRAGQRLGWSGRSGTGSPHLHFEVRRGDVAYNPLRAGIAHDDRGRPVVAAVTLEPLDEFSRVARGAAPRTVSFGAAAETLVVEGRVRAIVRAVDPGERRASMAPYAVGAAWGGAWIEARFDSASWATDMAELDQVYDRGRAAPFSRTTVQLWRGPGVPLVSIRASAAPGEAAGAIEVAPGDDARPLRVWARDLAGRRGERTLWLRGPRPEERGPAELAGGRGERGDERFEFAPLPAARLRIAYRGAPAGAREVRVMGRPATCANGVWSAVVPPQALAGGAAVEAAGLDAAGAAFADTLAGYRTDLLPALAVADGGGFQAGIAGAAPFEPSAWVWDAAGRALEAEGELEPLGRGHFVGPVGLPLREGAKLTAVAPGGSLPGTAGLCRDDGEGWGWEARATRPGATGVTASSRRLGRFALFADQRAPEVTPHAPPRRAVPGPYPTWALTARLADAGSGVDGRASHFVVDGRRVPSEWDAVRGVLRWRPPAPPAAGRHRVEVVARDRAGNERRAAASFVLD